jgi:hypothetical protein
MEDNINLLGEHRLKIISVGNITLDLIEIISTAKMCEIAGFPGRVVVDTVRFDTVVDEEFDEIAPDESTTARHYRRGKIRIHMNSLNDWPTGVKILPPGDALLKMEDSGRIIPQRFEEMRSKRRLWESLCSASLRQHYVWANKLGEAGG